MVSFDSFLEISIAISPASRDDYGPPTLENSEKKLAAVSSSVILQSVPHRCTSETDVMLHTASMSAIRVGDTEM